MTCLHWTEYSNVALYFYLFDIQTLSVREHDVWKRWEVFKTYKRTNILWQIQGQLFTVASCAKPYYCLYDFNIVIILSLLYQMFVNIILLQPLSYTHGGTSEEH